MEQAIERLYGSEGTARVIEEMKREAGSAGPDIVPAQLAKDGDSSEGAPTIRFVNSLIERAFAERASDIHLEPQEGEMVVRMRIDGLLRRVLTVPAELQSTVISRLKIMGGMDIAERKVPQDGHAMLRVKGSEIDLRGATGSGKSTTMCVMLRDLAREEVNIVTLEDPVEYYIPGVSQCQINEKTGMTFAGGLRAILRQDPDIISVGEIRDGETASIAMRAAITGHLVLSTLHTNDAPSAVDRLRDVGVEPWLISGALRGVVSQRLVRRICPHCKRAYHPASDELALLGLDDAPDLVFYKGEGCPDCHHTGYTGRRAVFEILMLDAPLRRLITAGASADELADEACRHGFTTMRERCRDLVLRGETTAEEAARTISSTIES